MSAVAASAAALSEVIDGSVGASALVRRQRVRVPLRLVVSPYYQDVALSVYVKVKALAARPEGCQAKSSTIALYLGLSVASVERGMTQLRRPGLDGVVELCSERRTLPGGRGQSALRTVRPMDRAEAFVWLPVAAAEDLTPRQLRAYALIAYAQVRGIALTEAELAAGLRHHSGSKAGQALSVTAASAVVDQMEAARWVTVQRRVGERGRHRYIAHDVAPEGRPAGGGAVAEEVLEAAVDSGVCASAGSLVGAGSGSLVGEGSLAYEESPRTDSPDDARALASPAVGEVPVVGGAEAVENPVEATSCADPDRGLALRAGGNSQPTRTSESAKRSSRDGGSAQPLYTGPQLAMSAQIYAVLEPVHLLLQRVTSDFVARKVAREVGRQLREGMTPERLRHRLTSRFAGVMLSDIRDAGRWLLGVALPRWGCGHLDCESGTMWSTGRRCDVCAEVIADRFAARQRVQRIAQGLCPEHGTRPGPSGACVRCELDEITRRPAHASIPAPAQPEGRPRGSCGSCSARIFLIGRALEDRRCKPCREEAAAQPGVSVEVEGPVVCSGRDGSVPCGRVALPSRSVCARHRMRELAAERTA